jgi:hypothetical protein
MTPIVLIGTPTHRSTFPGTFYECLNQTERHLAANKIRSWWVAAKGCGVEWNRNKLVSVFLASEATHLLFVDTDMAWSPKTVLRWALEDRDIVAGAALARRMDAAQWNVQPVDPPQEPDEKGYVRVARAGTGLMMIARRVLEKMSEAAEPYFETYDVERKPLRRLFYFDIDPVTRELRGEDYNFTRDAQVAGFDVWCDTDARVGHLHEVPISAGIESLHGWLKVAR